MFFKILLTIFLFIQNVLHFHGLEGKIIKNIIVIPDPPDVTDHKNLDLLDHNLCGPVTEPKIFGGNKAKLLEFPWMALLGYQIEEQKKKYISFRCAGTIINKRYILTAAHCIKFSSESGILTSVRVGDYNKKKEKDCDKDMENLDIFCVEKYQEFKIEIIHIHPEYLKDDSPNDIALLRLDKDINFEPDNVKPICLPIGSAAKLTQKMVTVTGWGATEEGVYSDDLLMVHLSLFPIEECDKIYKKLPKHIRINYKQICAGGKKGFDSCKGDSGGPLISPAIYNNDVKFIQYGIVSFGFQNCGFPGIPGVYTKISYFMDWILNTIKE